MKTRPIACRRARRDGLAVFVTAAAMNAAVATAAASDTAAASATMAPTSADQTPPDDDSKRPESAGQPGQRTNREPVLIQSDKPWLFNRETRYKHSLPEINGETITVTKKTSVVKLDDIPTIIDNNQRELFNRL